MFMQESLFFDTHCNLHVRAQQSCSKTIGQIVTLNSSSVSVLAQDGIVALGKAHTLSAPSLSSLPKVALENSTNICLVEHRSFSTLEGGMSVASFLRPSFLQAINAVMLWPVHGQKIPQASDHLCPANLQTRCDICCACQSICKFIPADSGVPHATVKRCCSVLVRECSGNMQSISQ